MKKDLSVLYVVLLVVFAVFTMTAFVTSLIILVYEMF